MTSAEQTSSNVTAFTPTGITLSSNGAVNANTETYVAWAWLGANSTASNTAGSITSTVSANTTSGFSIVSYTGNGTANAALLDMDWCCTKFYYKKSNLKLVIG
jgi:hypothetical protein